MSLHPDDHVGEGPTMPRPADTMAIDDLLDEALAESFPASDPLSFWSGPDLRTGGGAPEAVPEADEPRITRASEASEPMEGPATG
jgi:hypothetical protein